MNPIGQVPGGTSAVAALGVLGKVLCLSLACGLGPYLSLVPARLRGAFVGTTLLLTLGMGFVLIAAVHCVWLGVPLTWAVPGAATVSAGFLVWGLRRPREFAARLGAAGAGVWRWKYHLGASAALAALLSWPGWGKELCQPIRVGLDELGYAITGQFLLDGGDLASLGSRVKAETGEEDLGRGLDKNGTTVNVNTNVASEFLLRSMRWYPSGVAAVLAAAGERFVLPVQFLLLFFPLVLLFGVAHHFLRTLVGLSETLSVLGAASVLMNVNLLNVLCEGQHAQVFGSPFFLLLLGQLYFLRNGAAAGFREYAFTCLLSTVVLCSYPEMAFLTLVLTGLIGCLDLVLVRKICDPKLLKFALAAVAGFVLAGGYALVVPMFLWKHLANMQTGNVGFWQPQWAVPAEVLGLFNIYDPAVQGYVGRQNWTPFSLFAVVGLSALCVEVVVLRILSGVRCDYSYWLAPLLFIAVVFLKVFLVNRIHNYQYMKAYTLVLVPVLGFFFGSMALLSSARAWPRMLLPACMVWMIGEGGAYLRQYAREAIHVSCPPARAERLRAGLAWDDYVWVTMSQGYDQFAYASLVPFNWVNMGGNLSPHLPPHFGKKIGIWSLKDLAGTGQKPAGGLPVLYEDDQVALFDTGLTLQADTLAGRASPGYSAGSSEKELLVQACAALLRTCGFQ
jgi:hypothetical protein